jgi:uncharacterized coiled-coil protein SlyX
MNVAKLKKQLQLKKFESSKFEIEIKIAERTADIDRLKESVSEWDEAIEKIEDELKSMED